MRKSRAGFTLIELMIVVAIIGILAAIAIPKFAELIRKSSEGASKGNLGSIRSAMSIYYADMEGQYPSDPTTLTLAGKYLTTIPPAKAPNYHSDISAFSISNFTLGITEGGGWIYDGIPPADSNYGQIYVNCVHTDSKGSTWVSY